MEGHNCFNKRYGVHSIYGICNCVAQWIYFKTLIIGNSCGIRILVSLYHTLLCQVLNINYQAIYVASQNSQHDNVYVLFKARVGVFYQI
jgi:hypothetical protein